jgi:hypothetical protein
MVLAARGVPLQRTISHALGHPCLVLGAKGDQPVRLLRKIAAQTLRIETMHIFLAAACPRNGRCRAVTRSNQKRCFLVACERPECIIPEVCVGMGSRTGIRTVWSRRGADVFRMRPSSVRLVACCCLFLLKEVLCPKLVF